MYRNHIDEHAKVTEALRTLTERRAVVSTKTISLTGKTALSSESPLIGAGYRFQQALQKLLKLRSSLGQPDLSAGTVKEVTAETVTPESPASPIAKETSNADERPLVYYFDDFSNVAETGGTRPITPQS